MQKGATFASVVFYAHEPGMEVGILLCWGGGVIPARVVVSWERESASHFSRGLISLTLFA